MVTTVSGLPGAKSIRLDGDVDFMVQTHIVC